MNTYGYVGGNPIIGFDPFGLFSVSRSAPMSSYGNGGWAKYMRRKEALENFGRRFQNAINKEISCECKNFLQKIYDKWDIYLSPERVSSYDATTPDLFYMDTTIPESTWGGESTGTTATRILAHELAHNVDEVRGVSPQGTIANPNGDPNEIAANSFGRYIEQALSNGNSLCSRYAQRSYAQRVGPS